MKKTIPAEKLSLAACILCCPDCEVGLSSALTCTSCGRSETIVLYEKAFHDKQARYYDKLFSDPLPLGKYYVRRIRLHAHSYISQQPLVVDLCCGAGKSSLPLIEPGGAPQEITTIFILIQADAPHPPLRNECCGAIINCWRVAPHSEEDGMSDSLVRFLELGWASDFARSHLRPAGPAGGQCFSKTCMPLRISSDFPRQ